MEQPQQPQQPKNDFERARQSLRIMQAALEKAKTNHGDLFTFGDCASVYAAMMNMNTFIEKYELQQSVPQQSPSQQTQSNLQTPFQTLNHTPPRTVNYQTN